MFSGVIIEGSLPGHFLFAADAVSLKFLTHNILQRGTDWGFKYSGLRFVFKWLKCCNYVMHHQFDIQQLYTLPTLYLCVLYLSENKQWLMPLTA